jgi:AAA domain-containing protein
LGASTMIIVLTGPTGVGKTDTSWALVELAPPMVFLDCDWFAARVPFSWTLESDVDSVYEALSVMLDYYTSRASARFVIPLTLEMAVSYGRNRQYFDRFHLPLFHFRLSCSADLLRERVLKRGRNPVQRSWELDVIPSQLRICEALPDTFIPIDVSAMDEHAVARKILGIVGGAGQGAQQALATDAPRAARR